MEKGIFEHGCNPGFEENCGLGTDTIIKKLKEYGVDVGTYDDDLDENVDEQVWRENGVYRGPGKRKSGGFEADFGTGEEGGVKHAWVRLDDGTIIDGSSGQFMGEEKGYNPKGENFKSTRNIKHRNRLRIIHPDSKLQKYYEVDPDDTEERFYKSTPPGYYDSKQRRAYKTIPNIDWAKFGNELRKVKMVSTKMVNVGGKTGLPHPDGSILDESMTIAVGLDDFIKGQGKKFPKVKSYDQWDFDDEGSGVSNMLDMLHNAGARDISSGDLPYLPHEEIDQLRKSGDIDADYDPDNPYNDMYTSLVDIDTGGGGEEWDSAETGDIKNALTNVIEQYSYETTGKYHNVTDQDLLEGYGNQPKVGKSTRIQTARQRLADIFDVIEGGKIKDVKYYDDPPVDKPYYKRFYMKPRTFLDTAAGGAGRKRQKAVTDAHSDPSGSSDRNINRLAIEDHLKWVDYPKNKDIREMTNKEKIDLSMTDDINYNVRGDELGGVEYYKRKLRRGDPIGEPSFTFATPSKNEGRKRILGHEGRHRAKALMEEGVKRIPVKVVGYSGGVVEKYLGNRKKLKGAVEYEPGHLKSDKDTRYPILGRKAKLRQRIGRLTEHDVERSHEGPVTRRKADKPVKKFYEEKHKTYGEDRIKKIREEAELEGMFETGDKRIPLQKVNKPFHSKKPFLSSFTPGNAKKLAKVRKADDDDKPFSRKELEKERKNYEESIKRKRRSPTKSELKNRNVRLDKATDYFNKSRKKFDEDLLHPKRNRSLKDRNRESDAIEKEFVNRNRKVNPKKHEGGTTIRNKKRFSKLKQRIAIIRKADDGPEDREIKRKRKKKDDQYQIDIKKPEPSHLPRIDLVKEVTDIEKMDKNTLDTLVKKDLKERKQNEIDRAKNMLDVESGKKKKIRPKKPTTTDRVRALRSKLIKQRIEET
tara:strand:+ start:4 stop:2772 length:2769 start_codon:yes stop_codon:yes gene_type:complete